MQGLSISSSQVGKTSVFYFLNNAFLTLNSLIFQNNFQNQANSKNGFFLTLNSGKCQSIIFDLSFTNNSGCNLNFSFQVLKINSDGDFFQFENCKENITIYNGKFLLNRIHDSFSFNNIISFVNITNVSCEGNNNNTLINDVGGTCFTFRNTNFIFLKQIYVLNSLSNISTIGIKIVQNNGFTDKDQAFNRFYIFVFLNKGILN